MSLTLAQAAPLSTDDLQRGVVETFVQESPVLDRLPLLPIQGNAYAYNEEESLPGVAFRAVNAGYAESTGTVVQRTETLAILGGDADVDRFIVQTRGNLNDQRATQTRMKVKAASFLFQDTFINGTEPGTGDAATNSFVGLKNRLTGRQVMDATGIDLSVVSEAEAHDFFDMLDEAIALVPGASAIYANRGLISKVKSAGRRIGGTEMVREDLTGKRVVQYQGITMLDLGQNGAGADIIAKDEVEGTSDLYVVKFGQDETDGGVTGLTNGGVMVDDLGMLDSKPVYRTRIEFYCGLATFGGRAAARVTGIKH
jgi:hypothetical protein